MSPGILHWCLRAVCSKLSPAAKYFSEVLALTLSFGCFIVAAADRYPAADFLVFYNVTCCQVLLSRVSMLCVFYVTCCQVSAALPLGIHCHLLAGLIRLTYSLDMMIYLLQAGFSICSALACPS